MEEALLVAYIVIFFLVINILIIVAIGITSIRKFDRNLTKIHSVFKYLFNVAWIVSVIALLLFASGMICYLLIQFNISNHLKMISYFNSSAFLFCYLLMLIILFTLLYRLYFTFQDTMYQLSNTAIFILVSLYTLVFIGFLSIEISAYCVTIQDRFGELANMSAMSLPTFALYITLTIIAIVLFSKRLMLLTDNRASTINKFEDDADISPPQLNLHQIKMIENATRYISLLVMSVLTDCMTMIILFPFVKYYIEIESYGNKWQFILIMAPNITILVNIICLQLQYPFGTKYYNKYCSLMHKCWRSILTQQATSSLMQRYNDSKQENAKIAEEWIELQIDHNLDLHN